MRLRPTAIFNNSSRRLDARAVNPPEGGTGSRRHTRCVVQERSRGARPSTAALCEGQAGAPASCSPAHLANKGCSDCFQVGGPTAVPSVWGVRGAAPGGSLAVLTSGAASRRRGPQGARTQARIVPGGSGVGVGSAQGPQRMRWRPGRNGD